LPARRRRPLFVATSRTPDISPRPAVAPGGAATGPTVSTWPSAGVGEPVRAPTLAGGPFMSAPARQRPLLLFALGARPGRCPAVVWPHTPCSATASRDIILFRDDRHDRDASPRTSPFWAHRRAAGPADGACWCPPAVRRPGDPEPRFGWFAHEAPGRGRCGDPGVDDPSPDSPSGRLVFPPRETSDAPKA